jgi:hypothetical protein
LAGATSVEFSADATQLFVARGDGAICVFDTETGQQIQELAGHTAVVNDLRCTSDGKTLVSCGTDWTIRSWRREGEGSQSSWKPGPMQKRENELLGMAMSRDGKLLLTTERRASIGVWSLPELELIGFLTPDSAVWKPALSADGRWIAAGLWDRSIQMFSVDHSSRPLTDLAGVHSVAHLIGHSQLISAEAFNADSTLLASTSADGLVKIWDVSSIPSAPAETPEVPRYCLATLVAQAGEALVTTFLPKPFHDCVVVGYRDGSVRIWDLRHNDRNIEGQREYQAGLRRRAPQ